MAATLVCFEAGSNAGTVPTPLLHRPIGEDHQYYHHGDYLYHGNDCHQSDDFSSMMIMMIKMMI